MMFPSPGGATSITPTQKSCGQDGKTDALDDDDLDWSLWMGSVGSQLWPVYSVLAWCVVRLVSWLTNSLLKCASQQWHTRYPVFRNQEAPARTYHFHVWNWNDTPCALHLQGFTLVYPWAHRLVLGPHARALPCAIVAKSEPVWNNRLDQAMRWATWKHHLSELKMYIQTTKRWMVG